MRATRAILVIGAALLLAGVTVRAHHAFAAEFDVNKPLKLTGTLTKWEMVNPHSWFHITVKEADGKISEWLIEGGSPNQLIRMGVTKNTVPIGTELTIEGYRAKDGKVTPWIVEGGSPNQLIRLGVTKNTVPVGTELTIEGYQAKDGTMKAVGRNFVLADGKRLFLGESAGGSTDPSKVK